MLPRNFVHHLTTAYHPQAAVPAPAVSSREWATLTLYRDGLANLNGLATELLRTATTALLVPPPPTKPGRLAKAWQLHGNVAGGALLIPHGARVGTRFRDRQAATLLFADLPGATQQLSFALTPEPGHADRFRLLPV